MIHRNGDGKLKLDLPTAITAVVVVASAVATVLTITGTLGSKIATIETKLDGHQEKFETITEAVADNTRDIRNLEVDFARFSGQGVVKSEGDGH